MKHRIDPKIDCVFKALLGSLENRNLLAHFLNAILASDLHAPIVGVEILNPYNDKGNRTATLATILGVDFRFGHPNELIYPQMTPMGAD